MMQGTRAATAPPGHSGRRPRDRRPGHHRLQPCEWTQEARIIQDSLPFVWNALDSWAVAWHTTSQNNFMLIPRSNRRLSSLDPAGCQRKGGKQSPLSGDEMETVLRHTDHDWSQFGRIH